MDETTSRGAPPSGGPGPTAWSSRIPLRTVVLVLCLGVVAGIGWRLSAGFFQRRSMELEREIAADGALAGWMLLAGILTAILCYTVDRKVPVGESGRLLWVLGASVLGALIAARVGTMSYGPSIRAWGAVVVWPLTTSLLGFVISSLQAVRDMRRRSTDGATDIETSEI